MIKAVRYAPPRCEYERLNVREALLGESDLSDEGPGDALTGGEEFVF
ncbi:MAG: hypothetical protein J5737_07850 [Bacteroidales bacterium]|nr:hypothetical protein [Bacteroidales bacterium]